METFFEQLTTEKANEFTIVFTNNILSGEWYTGTTSDNWVPFYKRNIEKSRFVLLEQGVCYLSKDTLRIDFETGEYFQDVKKENVPSVPFSELWRRLSDTSIADQKKQDIKGPFKLAEDIKLFDMSNDIAINKINNLWNQTINAGDTTDFISWMINGPRPNIYKPSGLFAEQLLRIGFDGIAYKPTTNISDIIGPCNDAMIVLFEPSNGRELFHRFH